MGCTHSQTDVGLTISDGNLRIQTIGPKTSTDKLSDKEVPAPNRFDLKNDKLLTNDNKFATENSQVTTNELGKDNDTSTRKELEDQDKLGNFEIQDLMSDYKNDTRD